MRLLPKDQDWTAYAYLVYLPYFAVLPFLLHTPPWQRAAAVAATVAAVPLYFAGYWLRGRRVLWVIAGFVLLGSAFAKINPGASVCFVYAASFIGKAFEAPTAYRYLIGLLALVGLESWVWHFEPSLWISALVFSALIGSLVIHFAQRKRLTDRLLLAREELDHLAKVAERERIARDLHDLLGHTLSVIVLKSELASRLTATDPARAAAEIRDVERISREALTQVRSAVRGYRSAGLASELREALEALAAAGIQVETSVEAPPLSAAQETVLGLALREGVTNVVRHARATACRLTMRRSGPYCELEISDNGRGGALDEGSGLSGMRERVEALGGALERDSSQGTRLRIRVPV